MLRYTFGLEQEARTIESAVNGVLEAGLRTRDIAVGGCVPASTRQMGEAIATRVLAA
jgi:3-isopropylmalate dehydrogenase